MILYQRKKSIEYQTLFDIQ